MKMMTIALAALTAGGWAQTAGAQCETTYNHRHCDSCVEHFRWERQEVQEQVIAGYENRLVGYEDAWVCRTETVYETRTVTRRVVVGYDRCHRPIYQCRTFCERVPVCRTVRVCEKQPRYASCPIYETRTVCKQVRVPYYVCCD